MVKKVISSGETGACIGGLVGARRARMATGGFACRGYVTEAGAQETALRSFGLVAHPSSATLPLIKYNIEHADCTVVVSPDIETTQTVVEHCQSIQQRYLVINPFDDNSVIEQIKVFLSTQNPRIVNVTGNRESQSPGIASATARILHKALNS